MRLTLRGKVALTILAGVFALLAISISHARFAPLPAVHDPAPAAPVAVTAPATPVESEPVLGPDTLRGNAIVPVYQTNSSTAVIARYPLSDLSPVCTFNHRVLADHPHTHAVWLSTTQHLDIPVCDTDDHNADAAPGTITYNHAWDHRWAHVNALHGADFRSKVFSLALLRCNHARTSCLVRNINPHSRNYHRVGWASGSAIGAN